MPKANEVPEQSTPTDPPRRKGKGRKPKPIVKRTPARSKTTGNALYQVHRGKPVFDSIYHDDPFVRIELARAGLPATTIEMLSIEFDIPSMRVYTILGIAKTTALRQVSHHHYISSDATERAVYIAGLVKTVASMAPEKPAKQKKPFSARLWLADWLDTPHSALGGARPENFLDTADGRTIVARLLRSRVEMGTP